MSSLETIAAKARNSIPVGEYYLAKCDLQGVVTYVNASGMKSSGFTESELLGWKLSDVRSELLPSSMHDWLMERISQCGFVNYYSPLQRKDGSFNWGFTDLGKRYSPAENGPCLGYELVSYPASARGIDFFHPIYIAMLKCEQGSGDQGKREARALLEQAITDSGKPYDELVLTLQQA